MNIYGIHIHWIFPSLYLCQWEETPDWKGGSRNTCPYGLFSHIGTLWIRHIPKSTRIIVPSRPMGTCSEGSSPLLYGQLTILSPYLRSRHSFMRHSSIRQFNCQGCAATQFNCQGHARAQLNCQVHPGTQFSLVPFSYSYSQMFPFPDLFATIRHISISPLATSHSYTFSSVNSPSFPLLLGHHIWPGLHHYSQWHNSTFSTFLSTAFPGHHLSQGYISKVTRITPRSQLFFPCIPISLLLQSF